MPLSRFSRDREDNNGNPRSVLRIYLARSLACISTSSGVFIIRRYSSLVGLTRSSPAVNMEKAPHPPHIEISPGCGGRGGCRISAEFIWK